jgi:hypothetical protein
MNRFFRENLLGIVTLSALGSLIATIIGRLLPTSGSGGSGLTDALFSQIPVWTLFPYSVGLMLIFAWRALRKRQAEQSPLKDQIAALRGERDAVRHQFEALKRESDALRDRLANSRSTSVSASHLMRFVAVVLSTAQGSPSNPITHEYVCGHVAGLAGEGVAHSSISEALGSMMQIGAVVSSHSGLVLVLDWKDKMRAAGVADV